ncbi:MAG: tetratricopeptide repeat protein [Tannerella sp.]|jgi:tetratricopeptide (TPR) repeat protein|nr:tetratricopeptide repeat protein [Tannerella sp.]
MQYIATRYKNQDSFAPSRLCTFALITIFFFFASLIKINAQEAELKEAETAYIADQYDKAAEIYETLLKNYGNSYELLYNLGNAYYKAGKIASAILNYERALLIKHGDGDIQFNLEMAKQMTIDKIEPNNEFFLAEWFRGVQNMIGVDSWATVGIFSFVMFIVCLVLFFFSKWMRLRKTGFYLGILLFIMVIFANVFAYNQKKELIDRRGAIVFTPTVTVKSSPDNSGTDLFVIHEGTKVFIKNTVGDWNEISLEDDKVGWVQKKDITVI